jgi:D-alanyl-lipoteichoic acid acyltransferase DltB (MBOAT superfamily)
VLGIVANLAVLAMFKYLAFIAGALVGFAGVPVQGWSVILPLGISFYTFELISYLADLSKGDRPNYPLRRFCLFIFLFPHLVAGPIIRHNESCQNDRQKNRDQPRHYQLWKAKAG